MIFDLIYLFILLFSVLALIENRVRRLVLYVGFQGLFLIGPVMQLEEFGNVHSLLLMVLILVFKTFLTPVILFYIIKKMNLPESTNPRFGYLLALLLFLPGLAISLKIADTFNEIPVSVDHISLTYVFLVIYTGIITFLARKHWIAIIIGFIIFENGVFLLTLILEKGLPLGTEIISFLDAVLVIVAASSLQLKVRTELKGINQ